MNLTIRGKAILWQVVGGIVALFVILCSIAELLWWCLFLSDRTNVTADWTWIIHVSSAITLVALILYQRMRRQRERVFQQAFVRDAERFGFDVTLFTFPTHVNYMFLGMAMMLSVSDAGMARFFTFVLLVVFGIFTHELGHAIVARKTGHSGVRIQLHALGGTTFFSGGQRKAQRVAVTIAGPAVGIAVGLFLMELARIAPSFRDSFLYHDMLFVTMGWSLLNLLPILPLDGGVLMAAAVKSDSMAQMISIVVAFVGIPIAQWKHQEGFTLFFVVLALSNLYTLPKVSATVARWNRRVG